MPAAATPMPAPIAKKAVAKAATEAAAPGPPNLDINIPTVPSAATTLTSAST